MKRWHGGRLVDVASLGVSVINRDGRMEGREELRRSCSEQEQIKISGDFVRILLSIHLNSIVMKGSGR